MKKRTVALLMAAVLLFGAAVGGTLAWLQDSTDPIVNTFTAGHVKIGLEETKPDSQTAKMVPGATIEKDPKITVAAGSEACYVYVKVETAAGEGAYAFDKYISYELDGWTALEGVANVFYKTVNAATANEGTTLNILVDEEVTVLNTVTSTMLEKVSNDEIDVTMTFTGYAVQQDATLADAKAAWVAAGF